MFLDQWMNDSARELFNKLFTEDFDPVSLRKELEAGKYDAENINVAALNYIDECDSDFPVDLDQETIRPGEIVPGLPSSHVTEVIELLLDYGLDPNRIYREYHKCGGYEEYNIMQWVQFIHNGYQAADSLYLMLSHGGNPNLTIDNLKLADLPDTDVIFWTENRSDLHDYIYASDLHYWMVLAGFGAILSNGKPLLKPAEGYDLSRLRNHHNYYYGTVYSDKCKEGWELCIFSRKTNWEVARF